MYAVSGATMLNLHPTFPKQPEWVRSSHMDLVSTLIILTLSGVIFFWARYRDGQPPNLENVQLIPYRTICIVTLIIAFFMIVHLVNMAGLETGNLQR